MRSTEILINYSVLLISIKRPNKTLAIRGKTKLIPNIYKANSSKTLMFQNWTIKNKILI